MNNTRKSVSAETIKMRKEISTIKSEVHKETKSPKCLLCGKKKDSFCNSHTIPQFVLKEIAVKGLLYNNLSLTEMRELESSNGINKAGTFRAICKECDNTFFQNYENPENLLSAPTDRILAEIAVKNYLIQLVKAKEDVANVDIFQKRYGVYENPEEAKEIPLLDKRNYEEELELHMSNINKKTDGAYRVLFYDVLPYKVPIAVQSAVTLSYDMENNKLNDVFDYRPKTKMQDMHICVFPYKGETIVLLFHHKKDRIYQRLRHQINVSKKEDILRFLNYVIFEYTENYYLHGEIIEKIKDNEKLKLIAQENHRQPNFGFYEIVMPLGSEYQPVKMDEIPNLLSPEWQIKE